MKTILMIMFWTLALVVAVGLIIFGAVSAFSDNTDETNLPEIVASSGVKDKTTTEIADRYYEALNTGSVSEMITLLDTHVILTEGAYQVVGKGAVLPRLIRAFSTLSSFTYSDARVEGNSFLAYHNYLTNNQVDNDQIKIGIYPLANVNIELVVQNNKVTFINVTSLSEEKTSSSATIGASKNSTPPANLAEKSIDQDEIRSIRKLAFDYWIAMNEHDSKRVFSYLDQEYRRTREQQIYDYIDRVKAANLSLGVSQLTSPKLTSGTEGEMTMNVTELSMTRSFGMQFRKIDGEWKIVHAEAID